MESHSLESYFKQFRDKTIGNDQLFSTPYGDKRILYADWIASGRLYAPIEEKISFVVGPFVGNTHSEASETGQAMTIAYKLAHKIIKKHVNATEEDIILTTGTGMTGCINKLQRILGLKAPERVSSYCGMSIDDRKNCLVHLDKTKKPVVFLTHVEHHSNHTGWFETFADVVVLPPTENLLVDLNSLYTELDKYKDREIKIGSFSACSNVTGYIPPYHQLAKIMHEHQGFCFVDFAASAPYKPIDMHPSDPMESLDAIFFSPHKFLGGPGSSGVLIFNKNLYHNNVPDEPGGGTVRWTNRWGDYSYIDDIEAREDGGTPGFLQAIRAAYCIRLKEQMGCDKIHERETELLKIAFVELKKVKGLRILAEDITDRLGVISFYIEKIHHNLIVKLLNDRFGVQVRGGCSCAGTYGHYLLDVDIKRSYEITDMINNGDLTLKPGWVRMSLHPTMTDAELLFIADALNQIVENIELWKKDYIYSNKTNEFYHTQKAEKTETDYSAWFDLA